MAANFSGWDPMFVFPCPHDSSSLTLPIRLNQIISCSTTALKWKLLHFEELDQWTRVRTGIASPSFGTGSH